MFDPRMLEKIEPVHTIWAVAKQFTSEVDSLPFETKILLSIAISVKRIADAIEVTGTVPRK